MREVTVVERSPWWREVAIALGIGKWTRDDHDRVRRGEWMQTFTGGKFYPLDARPEEILITDVIVGLARECRYGNHCRDYYSVAEHCVLVSVYAERLALERGWSLGEAHEVACEGLMHDATEAYLGDVPRPIKKQRVMRGYRGAEDRLCEAVYARFDIRSTKRSIALVKEVDTRILIDEIEALMIDPQMWWDDGRYLDVVPLGAEIAALSPDAAARVFSRRFAELFPEHRRDNSVDFSTLQLPRTFACPTCDREHEEDQTALRCCEEAS